MSRSKLAAIVAGVVAIAAGSTAYAAIPDGGGVIHACYNKNSGAVRVTDTDTNSPAGCSTKEKPLQWNQQGPKGDRGPSNAYATYTGGKLLPAGGALTQVASRTVPPGNYVLSANAEAYASGPNIPPSEVKCLLQASNGSTVDYAEAWGNVSSDSSKLVVTLTPNFATDILANTGGTVSLVCESQSPYAAFASYVHVTALQVESLDMQ
jgi:hypothetical protein